MFTHDEYVKEAQKHNAKMIKLGATTIYDLGDINPSDMIERGEVGVFKTNSGYKKCQAPYNKEYASYDGKVVGQTGVVKKTFVNNAGYEVTNAFKDGKSTTTTVHRLVASAWIPNDDPTNKRTVDHIDSNKLNNSADNLHWLSYSENLAKKHRMSQMTTAKGKQNGVKVVKVDDDGTRTEYRSFSAAGKANGMSAVSVTGNAKGTLKLDKSYHFELL